MLILCIACHLANVSFVDAVFMLYKFWLCLETQCHLLIVPFCFIRVTEIHHTQYIDAINQFNVKILVSIQNSNQESIQRAVKPW